MILTIGMCSGGMCSCSGSGMCSGMIGRDLVLITCIPPSLFPSFLSPSLCVPQSPVYNLTND